MKKLMSNLTDDTRLMLECCSCNLTNLNSQLINEDDLCKEKVISEIACVIDDIELYMEKLFFLKCILVEDNND